MMRGMTRAIITPRASPTKKSSTTMPGFTGGTRTETVSGNSEIYEVSCQEMLKNNPNVNALRCSIQISKSLLSLGRN